MSPELRAALRLVIEAYPAGSVAPMLREHALELLEGSAAQPAAPVTPPADLTVVEVARRFHRSTSTVRGWISGHRLRSYLFQGREHRITESALAEFEEAQRGTGAGKKPPGRARKVTNLGAWRTAS